jgi:saccharopine dehydrogenase-like NADP-dependent oxidoreductase
MTLPITFGIVGGYGASGRIVAAELWKSTDGNILIGGRDLTKAQAVAAEFDQCASAAQLDVLDDRSLNDFCGRCSIVVNCAGPVTLLQDRVAQAAFRARSHYVDAADMSLVKGRMCPHSREIEDLGLSFVISAGWNPGLSEFLPLYADAQARARMDTIESLSVYQADCGAWSTSALLDAASYIHKSGLQSPGYFHKGEWTRVKLPQASRQVDLGDPIGSRRFSLHSTPELREVGRQLNHCDFFPYAYVSGWRTIMAITLMASVPLPQGLAVRMVRNVFRRNRLPGTNDVGGFVVAQIPGSFKGQKLSLTARIVYKQGHDYRIHGVALATVARMVAERKGVKAGLHFLADAVDPNVLMPELRKSGVEYSENFEPYSA